MRRNKLEILFIFFQTEPQHGSDDDDPLTESHTASNDVPETSTFAKLDLQERDQDLHGTASVDDLMDEIYTVSHESSRDKSIPLLVSAPVETDHEGSGVASTMPELEPVNLLERLSVGSESETSTAMPLSESNQESVSQAVLAAPVASKAKSSFKDSGYSSKGRSVTSYEVSIKHENVIQLLLTCTLQSTLKQIYISGNPSGYSILQLGAVYLW